MNQALVNVHDPRHCEGRGCCIHHPSGHHMAAWPLNWRDDTKVMERLCPHGIGHPDPDHMAYVKSLTPPHKCAFNRDEWKAEPLSFNEWLDLDDSDGCIFPHLEWQGVHGCDGCCRPPEGKP